MEPWIIAVVCAASSIAGGYVSAQKRRPIPEGFLLGLLFGPFGLVTAACLPDDGKTPGAREEEEEAYEEEEEDEPAAIAPS